METAQKTILAAYLLIGLAISFFNLSCGKKIIEYSQTAEFVFVNNTAHAVTYPEEIAKYNILSKSSTTILQMQDGGEEVNEKSYTLPFIIDYRFEANNTNPSLPLKFDGNKCWSPNFETEHPPLQLNNYKA